MIVRFLLSPWIFYFLAILGLISAIILIFKGKKLLITASVLEEKADSANFVYDYICAEFPKACILKDVPISSAGAGNVHVTQTLDMLYISGGGVVIISVITGSGAFDNPKTGTWRFRYPGNNGKPVTVNIPNPFDSTIPAANILEGMLAAEKIYLDVQRIAVFSGEKVAMTAKYKEAMTIDGLIQYLTNINSRMVMNGPQFRSASETVTAFAQYNQYKTINSRHFNSNKSENIEKMSSKMEDKDLQAELSHTDFVRSQLENEDSASHDETIQLLKEIQFQIDSEAENSDQEAQIQS